MSGSADTILLTATRNADLETPIGAFMRFDDGGPAFLLESVEGGERLGRYSFLGVGPRRLLTVRDGQATIQSRPVGVLDFAPDLPTETISAPDPLTALRHFLPKRRILPDEGIPRFPGGAVGALAYDAVSTFEPTVPLPDRDPVGVPMAAFQETDLVLVFDHLTHTLSAVASLHTEAPDIEGRYAIAERAIFEALERTGRPTEAELAGLTRRSRNETDRPAGAGQGLDGAGPGDGAGSIEDGAYEAPASGLRQIEVSLGRGEYESAVRSAKEAIAAGEAIQIVVARRQTYERPIIGGQPLDAVSLYRSLRRVNPSPYLYFVRMPEFSVVGASPELLVRVEGDRVTTHPIAGTRPRGATPLEDDALAYALQRDPKERAEHVMLVDLGRNDLGRVARAGTVAVTKYMEVERYSRAWTRSTPCAASSRRERSRARRRSGRCSSSPRPNASGAGCTAEPWGISATTATSTPRSRSAPPSFARTGSISTSGRVSSRAPCRNVSSRRRNTRPGRSGGPSSWPSQKRRRTWRPVRGVAPQRPAAETVPMPRGVACQRPAAETVPMPRGVACQRPVAPQRPVAGLLPAPRPQPNPRHPAPPPALVDRSVP
jgi:anthranilate synthase component 1